MDAVKDLFWGSLDAGPDKAEDLFVTHLSRRGIDQVGHDIAGRPAERVGEDGIQAQPGYGHGVLETVLLRGPAVSKF